MILYGSRPRTHCTIGGKATGLYTLQETGILVPPFLVIPAENFDPLIERLPDDALADLRLQKLLAFTLSPSDLAAIEQILAGWSFPQQAVVVRSSVADEDGETSAFPGLMDSFLNLTTLTHLQEAIARCAASAYSDRAMAYRRQKDLTMTPRPAVIIQQQVVPVASGVLFSTFPDYPQEMAIHATFGFGEGLVSGQLDADEFYWLKQSGELHRQIIAKKTQQMIQRGNKGLYRVAVTPEKQDVPCLTATQQNDLFRMGTALEKALGRPQDVEFVVTDAQIFVVQSRPITQLIPEVIIYDNSNIQESYCGVTTPLTFSFASRAYATVYRQTMQTLGLSQVQIREQEPVITNLLGLVKGRIYYNINNWYRGLQLLPSFRQNKADMERMMGLEEPVDFVKDHKKSVHQKLMMLPGLLVNLSRLLWAFTQLGKRVPAFQAHFRQIYLRFYEQNLGIFDGEALLIQKQMLDDELLGQWTTPIVNDFYVMMTNGRAFRKLRKAGILVPEEFLSRYLSGDKQIESTQPVRAMYQLAAQARQHPELQQLILNLPADLSQQIRPKYPAFHHEVSQFIDQYGDRTVGELKLETVTMRLEPFVFYRYLRNYLTTDVLPETLTETTHLHTEAAHELTGLLAKRPVWFRRSILATLSRLQQAIRYRESLRLERTRLFGMYRGVYLALGEQLASAGIVVSARDVFYLTEAEIIRAINTNDALRLTNLITSRQQEFLHYENEEVPARVTVPSPLIIAHPTPTQQPDTLLGTGCVPGIITGEVIVITDPRDSLDVTGKIVCALRTDPGWAVLFPTCRAVLIEKGSSLSHSVILLRELGLPTIINVPGLTKRLKTGQTIAINGTSGLIKIQYHATH